MAIYLNLKRDGDLVFAAELRVGSVIPVTRVFGDADVKPHEEWTQQEKDDLKAELIEVCRNGYPEILEGEII